MTLRTVELTLRDRRLLRRKGSTAVREGVCAARNIAHERISELSTGRSYLASPGPPVVPDQVLQTMHRASPNIYAGALVEMTATLIPDLQRIAGTRHQVAI
ncbi:hypothetical protein [Leisingera sp. NJS204]|uniref:hypothetical protein n=1 Tax=Leisingera sp. NJS204 TaxID=2508307 RepID=UPI003F8D81D5